MRGISVLESTRTIFNAHANARIFDSDIVLNWQNQQPIRSHPVTRLTKLPPVAIDACEDIQEDDNHNPRTDPRMNSIQCFLLDLGGIRASEKVVARRGDSEQEALGRSADLPKMYVPVLRMFLRHDIDPELRGVRRKAEWRVFGRLIQTTDSLLAKGLQNMNDSRSCWSVILLALEP